MRPAKKCDPRRLAAFCAALGVALLTAVPGAQAAQAQPLNAAAVEGGGAGSAEDQSRVYYLDPVGPEVIWDQIDQQCGGEVFRESYSNVMGWLRNIEPPGGAGADYWNDDGQEPTPAFICTGAQHLYLLDQVEADGGLIDGVDLKYWTTTTGACGDNYIKVHFRQRTTLPAIGNYISNPGEYVMGPMPVNVHPPPDPAGYTAYFIRMSTPYCFMECNAGYLVAELEDEGLPVDLNFSNLVEGTQVETEMPLWLPTTSIKSRAFGVAMSLNEGWDGDPDTEEPTMGWYLASHDYANVDPAFDMFAFLDKDGWHWTDPNTGGVSIGPGNYGGANCLATPPIPEASMYMVLWAKERGLPEPNDQFNWNDVDLLWEGMAETGITGAKQGCLVTPGRIEAHGGDLVQPEITDPFLDVDIYRVTLASRGPITIGGEQYCRRSFLRVDIDSYQPIDLVIRLWDSTKQELLLGDTLRHQDGTFANSDPERVEGEPNYGEDVLVPSLDPLLVFDGMYCDPVDSSTIILDDYFIGVSWEQNDDYDPSVAGSGTVVGDLETQGDQIGAYYMRIATGFLTRQAGAATVVDDIDDQIDRASALQWVSGSEYTSGPKNLGGNHMFRGHDLGSTDPLEDASCVGDVDIYEVPESEYADGYGIHARVESVVIGGNNMAIAMYEWDGVGTPELVAVGDDIDFLLADTDPVAYTTMSQAQIDAGAKWYVAVLGVGLWYSGDAGDFWYAANNFVDTLPIDITIAGTDDTNTGGQGPYELTVTVGPHEDVAHASAPSRPWEPNDSFAQADAHGLLPNQLDGGSPLNGVPSGQLHARYASADDPAIGGEPQGGGIYLGDGVHGENDTVDQGGDVDIYAFGANEGEVIEIVVDCTSTLTPVNPDRSLVSRCHLFDHERTLVASHDPYLMEGDYDTTGGCTGYRNMNSRLERVAPRTGTYYAVVVGADTRKPFVGAQLPYDLNIPGTVLGGLVRYNIGVYCSPAAQVGFYDLTVELSACSCGDTDRSGGPVDLNDFALFANCFGLSSPSGGCGGVEFVCSDLDGSGVVDLSDFATFALLYGLSTTDVPPNCLE